MSNLHRITALFSSAVLFLISINTEDYGLFQISEHQNSAYDTISSYYTIEKPDLFLLNRHGERFVTSFKNLPVSNLKYQINYSYGNYLSSEIKKLYFNSDYISYSGTIYRNLTNSDIVFPFHYFW